MQKTRRLAVLITHPIQYYSPLFRYIQEQAEFDIKVFYQSKCSIVGHFEKEFGRTIKWDNELLEGYKYEFLPSIGGDTMYSRFRPWCYGLKKRLRSERFDALLILGYNRPFHWYAIWLAWRLGIRTFLRDDSNLFSKARSNLKFQLKRIFFKVLNSLNIGILAVGQGNRDYYIAHGTPAAKINLMRWAVDNQYFLKKAELDEDKLAGLRADLGLFDGQAVFLFVGKLAERKGVRDLLAAFLDAHRTLERKPALVFVGDGDLRKEIENIANTCVDIKLVGFRNQSELPLFYRLADVLILPSNKFESWGLVVNEAMCVGKPSIVSDKVGCWPDLIVPDVTGWVFREGNITELGGLLKSVAANIQKVREMRQNCFAHIAQFSFAQNTGVLTRLLNEHA